MQRLGAVAPAVQGLGQLIDFGSCAAEDDGRRRRLDIEDSSERGGLVVALHHVHALPNQGLTRLGVAEADLDLDRVGEVTFGNGIDARWQCRREKHGLTRLRRRLQNRLDVLREPHVEHLIGLVENDDLDIVERECVARNVVECATGRRDDDMHTVRECLQLTENRLAAVDRHNTRVEIASVLVQRLRHLNCQLPGRYQHQRHWDDLGPSRRQPLQNWQREGSRLAGTGRCLPDQVATFEQEWNRLPLNRCRLFVAEPGQRCEQFWTESESIEAARHVVRRFGLGCARFHISTLFRGATNHRDYHDLLLPPGNAGTTLSATRVMSRWRCAPAATSRRGRRRQAQEPSHRRRLPPGAIG